MSRFSHTRTSLAEDLARMGVRRGSTLILHSSMKSIGQVAGGPRTVIRALQQAVGAAGTILMPTFSFSLGHVYEATEPFDPAASPARTGLIPDTFLHVRGVRRSLHPTHSVGIWGRRARELAEGHERRGAFDAETPLHRAAVDGATILMVGCSFTSLSLVHVAETLAAVPYLGIFCWGHRGWKPEAAVASRGAVTPVSFPSVPGCSHSFGVVEEAAEARGLIRHVALGNAPVLLAPADRILELAVSLLRDDPSALLCPASTCRACDEKRFAFAGRSPAARRVRGFLVETAGSGETRVAGSDGERRAAELVASRLREIGLGSVAVHPVPIAAWEPGVSTLEVRLPGSRPAAWGCVSSAPCAHAPATPTRGIEAGVVDIENLSDIETLGPGRGRIGVLWDGYGRSERELRRLMSRGFGGFVYVDRRFAHGERVAVGFPARWIPHLTAPMVSVPFAEAARLFGRGPMRARLRVTGSIRDGLSCNVWGELPGRSPAAIVVCAHHDSTFNTSAPDDNLTGIAAMLEIARRLVRVRGTPRRTIRFCSFGAEELLSEGARVYALEEGGAREVLLVLNNDSMGSRVGSTDVSVAGPAELDRWIARRAASSPLALRVVPEVVPFSDHFPFNAAGVPSLWFRRQTLAVGRHFHHTTGDCLAEISADRVAALAAFQASLLEELAYAERWPFPARIPGELMDRVAGIARDWIGLPR